MHVPLQTGQTAGKPRGSLMSKHECVPRHLEFVERLQHRPDPIVKPGHHGNSRVAARSFQDSLPRRLDLWRGTSTRPAAVIRGSDLREFT